MQGGAVSLNQAARLRLTLTQALSRLFLEEVNPLSISSVFSKTPLIVSIPSEGVSISPHWNRLNVPSVHIELGKVYCHSDGNLDLTLALLKAKGLGDEKDLELWFTPLDLAIRQGVVSVERTDILIGNTYQIALWGTIDLVQNRVDMVLGLTADCLKKAFGVKNLPKDYVLQIPMKGSLDRIRLDTSAATTKITALLAWQHKEVLGGLAGGVAGAIVGEVLNVVGVLPDLHAKAPSPKPLPWKSSDDTSE